MPLMTSEFGYYPNHLNFHAGDIAVTTLPDLDMKVNSVQDSAKVEHDWIYPGMMERHHHSGEIKYLP